MPLPSIGDVVYSWRKTLSERLDPPIREYVQSNQLFSCELVSTSQTQDAPIETLLAGSNTNVVVTSAAITTSQACLWVMLQAHPDNTARILIGNSAEQTWILDAGDSVIIPIDDVAKIIAKSAAGTQVLNGMWGY